MCRANTANTHVHSVAYAAASTHDVQNPLVSLRDANNTTAASLSAHSAEDFHKFFLLSKYFS